MLTWEYLVDTVRDDLPFILSVGTGCAISASCLEKRKHFYLRVAGECQYQKLKKAKENIQLNVHKHS